MRTTATMRTTPAAGIPSSSRVVDDHVERAAVVGDTFDCLDDLVLRCQQERHGVEVGRSAPRGVADPAGARDDCACLAENAAEQDHHDRRDDEQQHEVADPPERHRGLLSATTAALLAMPGSALRMMSNCALIAL